MTIENSERFSDLDLMYGGVTFYGDRKKVEKLYKDLLKNKEENEEYDPLNSNENIDPSIKLTCDSKNIEISHALDEVLYIEDIEDIEFVDDEAYFNISLWGGGFLPYIIFDRIVKKYEVDYINLSISEGIVYFYSEDKAKLKKVLNKILKDLEIEIEEQDEIEINIDKKNLKKENISDVYGIYKEEAIYYFYIRKQKDYYMTFEYIKELLEIDESINTAIFLYNMNSGFTCYDKSNMFFKSKYILEGPKEEYFDYFENSKEWSELKNIQGPKYEKYFTDKNDLIVELRYLTDEEIDKNIPAEAIEKYLSELNKRLFDDDIKAFMIYNINRIKEVPYCL